MGKPLLWKKILVGLFLGIAAGLAFGERTIHLKPLGDLFINEIGRAHV